uniref:Cell adhesion molecule L1-like b n=1 Tax=Cyclopterus lumpus TaxID=8103 RepID=A0A8C3ALV6_CYCLU
RPVEQLPTITAQSPSSLIAFPFDESFPMTCEAKGNPEPEYRWTKNGQEFDPSLDPRLMKEENSGTFVIPNNGNLTEYQGTYRCYASNKLGTAISKEIEFIVPHVPKFPKETLDPVVVEEGQAFVLQCDPPKGIPPLQIYWMTINLQHIEQDERVSMGLNGDLYFSHAVEKDSRRDYCCFAAFPRIRTIVQKTAMSVVVKTSRCPSSHFFFRSTSFVFRDAGRRFQRARRHIHSHISKNPTPQVEWVKMGHQLPVKAKLENHGKLMIVPRVDREDGGKYMCKAKNALGEAVHYFTLMVEGNGLKEPSCSRVLSSVVEEVLGAFTESCGMKWCRSKPLCYLVVVVYLFFFTAAPAANRKVFDDTIVLHNAKASDSAVYQCEASNKHGTLLSNTFTVCVFVQPGLLPCSHFNLESKGGVSELPSKCPTRSKDDSPESVEGPRFSVHDNGSLEIYGTAKDDAGQYTCLAKNTEGSSAVDAALYVKDPTRIVAAQEDQRILIGAAAQLSCLVELNPSWILLPSFVDQYRAFHPFSVHRYFVENGVLQILNVSHGDQGVYTCVARTPVDRDAASSRLTVLDVPDAPQYLVLSEHKSKSVKLKWIPGDDHNSSTTEFIIEYEESQWEPGNWKELLRVPGNHNQAVPKLHGHVDYRFRVSAVNAVGRGPPGEPTERYKPPPAAPDKNPDNIKIEGHLPHEMDINWEPLLPIEHNGPGLEYKVSYRRQDEEDWKEDVVKRHSFVVKNTPTFVPYEIKIQARNHQGWGPEPRIVTGYSGEDFPSAAPDDVAVEVVNGSVVKVSWTRVHKDKLHGHLGGYRVTPHKHTFCFLDKEAAPALSVCSTRLTPSLLYFMFSCPRNVGCRISTIAFFTPAVPERNPVFRVTDAQRHTVSLLWAPPSEPNGILTGYIHTFLLFLHPVNDTEEVGPLQPVNISNPNTTKWTLRDLEPVSKYKLYLRSCTMVGCGPTVSEECTTTLETISTQGWFIGLMCAIALLTLIVLIACFVNRNKGGKYSVKEKEDLHPDVESQGMNDDTFCEYSDNDEKPLKGSQHSLSREIKAGDSEDSLVDYGDEDVQFNEDGSFIGEYAGRKERKRASAEIKATIQTPA